ncbi:ABC transporter ATP-binding protein [Butyricicoccus pullicaecorum]|uniref:ABC transporter n=1 Tax=Butyricicoccus pullicaecorum TaxID=501571 RepID=A0A1Y4LJB9_9FIRM|nr:ABC transporter ATP-binding protein [Butyricicoccus pullicaecorum]OUP55970.1 ABC transporter [Butyricicoccus pullicaecorum]
MVNHITAAIRENKKASILAPIFVCVEVLFEVLIPVVMAVLIDKGIDAGDQGEILRLGGILIVMAVCALIFGVLAGGAAADASAGLARNLRHDIYHHVQNFSFANIDKFSTAGIVTRLTTDVTNVQNAYQMIIRVAVRAPVMLVFAFAMTVYISPRLATIYLCAIPILGIGLALIISRVHGLFTQVFDTYDELNNVVQENLTGIRVVKSFVREDFEKKKFGTISEKLFRGFLKAERLIILNMPLMQFCVYACLLLISWIGARLVVGGSMTTGALTSMFNYTFQILMSLMMLSMVMVMVIMARSSAERIEEILEEESSLKSKPDGVREVPDGSVDFENVSFSYVNDPNNTSLNHIDLHIRSGETVGILGGTGASKTTLVQLIPRLYDVTVGTVKVGGIDVREYDLEVLRNEVAMVLQKNTLFSGTIKENLRWGNEHASDEEIERVCRLAQADPFIQEMPDKYDTYIEQGGTNVSGGQKQRLCIARALLKKPKILILDDSTSAVDTKTDALIRQAFREEIPDTTKFIIAQRISSVQDADHILVLDDGHISAYGTHEELLKTSQIYQEVFASQQKGGEEDA